MVNKIISVFENTKDATDRNKISNMKLYISENSK